MKSEILELQRKLQVGLGAVNYLVLSIATSGRDFEFLRHTDKTGTSQEIVAAHAATLKEALGRVRDLMNFLGDSLNDCDAVTEEDEAATEYAFELTGEKQEAHQ